MLYPNFVKFYTLCNAYYIVRQKNIQKRYLKSNTEYRCLSTKVHKQMKFHSFPSHLPLCFLDESSIYNQRNCHSLFVALCLQRMLCTILITLHYIILITLIILHCITLYYITLYHIVLHYIILHYITRYYIKSYYTILFISHVIPLSLS